MPLINFYLQPIAAALPKMTNGSRVEWAGIRLTPRNLVNPRQRIVLQFIRQLPAVQFVFQHHLGAARNNAECGYSIGKLWSLSE
jgi:hypothetical protein